ncbi:MAG: hypothetical protein ACKN82_17080, partial [Pirellula sp.]
ECRTAVLSRSASPYSCPQPFDRGDTALGAASVFMVTPFGKPAFYGEVCYRDLFQHGGFG